MYTGQKIWILIFLNWFKRPETKVGPQQTRTSPSVRIVTVITMKHSQDPPVRELASRGSASLFLIGQWSFQQ